MSIIEARFQWHSEDLLRSRNLETGGKVQAAIDNAVIAYSIPYCPWQTGTLAKSPYAASQPGSGEVVYPGPYARYLYYGEVMGPNIPVFEDDSGEPTRYFSPPGQEKHLTGRQLQYDTSTNPMAGAFWFERMKADHADDIIKEAQSVANSK